MIAESQQRALDKYKKKSYDRIEVFVPKGQKDIIKEYAKSNGESVNGLINRLLNQELDMKKRA